jgi:hypothetical protein
VNTLRRRIAAGQVRAEQVQRPQGYAWRVYLDSRHPPTDPTVRPPDQDATGSLPQPPTQLAQADALASLIQATLTPIIGPLVAELTASRQANERQAERMSERQRQLTQQAELIGAQRSELALLRAEVETLMASPSSLTGSGAPETGRGPGLQP